MADLGDTIVALSSGRPPAAVAIVRSSGPRAFAAAEVLAGSLPPARHAALRLLANPLDGAQIDQALLLRFDAPHSATGEDIVEYQCHGGRATVDALLGALLAQPGVRLAEPGEFTRRALANGRIDLTEAEGLADLLAAETEAQRRSAMQRAGGALRATIDGWREAILAQSARAEVAIDYADEEDGAADQAIAADCAALANAMAGLLGGPPIEPLRDGIRVVVAGPPNAGKSSLVNALSQSERAIVTAIPGTTRDSIEVPLAIGGLPFVLVDTAGLRESDDIVEALGVERAFAEIGGADLVLWLGDGDAAPDHAGLIQISPKADLGGAGAGLPVSAQSGAGLADLAALLIDRASKLVPAADQLAIDRRQRDLLGEAHAALLRASSLSDSLLIAEELRAARHALDLISGRSGVEQLLDALFGRFCLGK